VLCLFSLSLSPSSFSPAVPFCLNCLFSESYVIRPLCVITSSPGVEEDPSSPPKLTLLMFFSRVIREFLFFPLSSRPSGIPDSEKCVEQMSVPVCCTSLSPRFVSFFPSSSLLEGSVPSFMFPSSLAFVGASFYFSGNRVCPLGGSFSRFTFCPPILLIIVSFCSPIHDLPPDPALFFSPFFGLIALVTCVSVPVGKFNPHYHPSIFSTYFGRGTLFCVFSPFPSYSRRLIESCL